MQLFSDAESAAFLCSYFEKSNALKRPEQHHQQLEFIYTAGCIQEPLVQVIVSIDLHNYCSWSCLDPHLTEGETG